MKFQVFDSFLVGSLEVRVKMRTSVDRFGRRPGSLQSVFDSGVESADIRICLI